MKKKLTQLLENALAACTQEGLLEAGNLPYLEMELTKDSAHGDIVKKERAGQVCLNCTQSLSPRRWGMPFTGNSTKR